MGKTLVVVYNLYMSSQSMKLTLTLLKMKKNILKAISILVSANWKVSSKKQDLLSLSSNKKKDYYTKALKLIVIDLLSADINFVNIETKLFYKTWPHCIDLTIRVNEYFDYMLAKLYWIPNAWDLLKPKLENHKACLHTSYNYWYKSCWHQY